MDLELCAWPLLEDLLVDHAEGGVSLYLTARHQLERLALRCSCLKMYGEPAALLALADVRVADLRPAKLDPGAAEALAFARLHSMDEGLIQRGWHAAAASAFCE